MNIHRALSVAFLLMITFLQAHSQEQLSTQKLLPSRITAAMLFWDFGAPEYMTLESIYPTNDSTRKYWNVVHRNIYPTTNGNDYDYYQIDAQTLNPVRSQMLQPNVMDYTIDFTDSTAHIHLLQGQDSISYTLQRPTYLAPE